jgi:phosphoenolpyruvate---glycerone phosphotransferase subunit DhaL
MLMELKPNQVRLMMLKVADAIIEAEPMLSQADRDLGDGDHGLGMKRGMESSWAQP